MNEISIRTATKADVATVLTMIRALAAYENREHSVVATEADIEDLLFGKKALAEALLAEMDGEVVGFALFIHTMSSFVGKRNLYLEDLFVKPGASSKGHR